MRFFIVTIFLLSLQLVAVTTAVPVEDHASDTDQRVTSWSWNNLSGTSCASGSTTGFASSLSEKSKELVIFFEGGGACFDWFTCYVLHAAKNVDGYSNKQFESDDFRTRYFQFFRNDSSNPFKDANYVFVPYCTGDVHAGNSTTYYFPAFRNTHHNGYNNGKLIIQAAKEMFPKVNKVFVGGESAGGFGAVFHYLNAQEMFQDAEIHVLSDSAETTAGFLTKIRKQWNPVVPNAGKCRGCDPAEYNSFLPALATENPKSRFAYMTYQRDVVFPAFYSTTAERFVPVIKNYIGNVSSVQHGNAHSFLYPTSGHSIIGSGQRNATAQYGTHVLNWLETFHSGKRTWTSV